MGASEFISVHPRLMQTILRHLESLRRGIEGDELYGLITRVLRKHGRPGPIGTPCFTELYHQLDAYARDPVALTTTRIKARLLQQHILPYLSDTESEAEPATIVESATTNPRRPDATDVAFHAIPNAQPEVDPHSANDTAKEGTLNTQAPPEQDRGNHYEMLRRSEQDAWQAIYGAVKDFSALKQLWTSKLDELSQQRDELERKLAQTEQHLKTAEINHEKLSIELESARRAPARKPTRRLARLAPRLVTRETFNQQIQAEISRVKRSGGSTTLALLGIENLHTIDAEHGAGADSAVLDCYAREILTGFRAYDIIGRYGEDAFMVLFPDTHQDGAVRALEKAQKRATQAYVRRDGCRFPLPSFHGVLTVYSPGEEPTSWLRRAEDALATARQDESHQLTVV